MRSGFLPAFSFPRAPFASPPVLSSLSLWPLSPVLAAEPELFLSPLVLCNTDQRVMTKPEPNFPLHQLISLVNDAAFTNR